MTGREDRIKLLDDSDSEPRRSSLGRANHAPSSETEAPRDKFMLAYLIFFLLGAGALFPWNAFVAAMDYWDAFYPSLNAGYTFSFVFMGPNFLFSVIALWTGFIKITWRIYTTFVVLVFTMQAVAILVIAHGEDHQSQSKALLILFGAVFGTCSATGNAAIFGMAAQFPAVYTQAVLGGQGIAGIVIIVLRVVTKAGFPDNNSGLRSSAITFFEIATVVLLMCLVGFYVLTKLPIAQHYAADQLGLTRRHVLVTSLEDPKNEPLLPALPQESLTSQCITIFKTIYPACCGVGFVFVVTFVVFPGLMMSMPERDVHVGDWYPIIISAFFMVGDLIGRMAAKWYVFFTERTTLYLIYSRIVLVWFFLIPKITPSWHVSNGLVMAAVFLTAISNGYLASMMMMFGPGPIARENKGMAGTVMSLCLSTGIAIGSLLAYMIDKLT